MLAPLPCDFLADGVAGAMDEPIAEAGFLDRVAGGPIDLPTLQRFLLGERIFDALHGRIAPGRHDVEDLRVLVGDVVADKRSPRQIAVDGSRLIDLGPEIDEHEIALANRAFGPLSRLVVRIAAMRADGADRRMIHDEAVLFEVLHDPALHVEFVHRAVRFNLLADEFPNGVVSRARVLGRFEVHRPLLIVPSRFEHLNQVAARHDLRPARSHQFNRAGIDA